MESPQTAVASSPQPASGPSFRFQNTYARLPAHFHARINPTRVAAPSLIRVNEELARFLGLDPVELASPAGVEVLAGNRVAEGSEPLAIAYAGHQFGHFVPQLGDGRANLLGEVLGQDGLLYDLQLKGSGPTPFSRRGDGRAALGPVLREYLVSEAMAALGVPTTRALAAVLTGERVAREGAVPGAVLTRVARSHLRVGTFQYFAARQDTPGLQTLANYAINRHDPAAARQPRPYRAFLDGVIGRQAHLVAQWMMLGFVHGVMNTDNTSISGETLDYGPCAFLEAYDPNKTFSSIDQNGRYAFANQPGIMLWNLIRLAECLLPLLQAEYGSEQAAMAAAEEALDAFPPQYEAARLAGLRRKLGLLTEQAGDLALADDLLARMASNRADFTLTFRRLCDAAESPEQAHAVAVLFTNPAAFHEWAAAWQARLAAEPALTKDRAASMRLSNPAYIPRNHQVEAVIQAATQRADFQPFHTLLTVLANPFTEQPGMDRFAAPAQPQEEVRWTFCGT